MTQDTKQARIRKCALALALGWAVRPALADDSDFVQWKAGDLAAKATVGQEPAEVLAAVHDAHVIVRLNGALDEPGRAALARAGFRLLRYLGDGTYFARVAPNAKVGDAESAGLADAQVIDPTWKQHPLLLQRAYPEYARGLAPAVGGRLVGDAESATDAVDAIGLYVLFHPDVDLRSDAASAVRRHGGVIQSRLESVNGAVILLPESELAALAEEDCVQWLEPPLPPMDELNNSNRIITQADIVQAPPYDLDGTGINVLVYDGGYALASHADLAGRLTVRDSSGLSDHSTHVAGTVGGSGAASGGLYRGMAPNVTIQSYGFQMAGGLQPGFLYTDPGDIEQDYHQAISTHGAVISNNSIGTNTAQNGFPCAWEGDYGVTSQLIDTIVRGDGTNPLFGEPFRIIWANGNERSSGRCGTDYHTTAPPACAKNHITVGALNSNDDSMTYFSSWGPTDDGRIKPDVSAPGCQVGSDGGVTSSSSSGGYSVKCGTSMASPTVCGLSALVLQDFKAIRPGEPLPRNSTLKALLAHNAVDAGNPGPDYKFGYGSVRIQDTIDFLRGGSYFEDTIDQADEKFYFVHVAGGEPALKVTIAWDDAPGAVNTIPELVNDIDLAIIGPNGATHYPWTLDPSNPAAPAVRTQADHVNNIEQVLVDLPQIGTWTIRVTGFAVAAGPQAFSLCASPTVSVCSSAGSILLDREVYRCASKARILLIDCDLDADHDAIETWTINVASSTDPAGKEVLLTETSTSSAQFAGTIGLEEAEAPGVLQIAHGDSVVATYNDADDGSGNPAVVTAVSSVDCQAPLVSDITVETSGTLATIHFTTDEPACAAIRYGDSCGSAVVSAGGACDTTDHSIELWGLDSNVTVYFVIDMVDAAGNETADDNDGACHTFQTDCHVVPEESVHLTGSEAVSSDEFAANVGFDRDTVISGARYDSELGSQAGAAYVFRTVAGSWVQEARLLASDGTAGDRFGVHVAISGDSAIVGAYIEGDGNNAGAGAAYIFRYNGTDWVEEAKLVASDRTAGSQFGVRVDIEGDVAVVGAWRAGPGGNEAGAAYVYRRTAGTWTQEAQLTASDGAAGDHFGFPVSVSGDVIGIGARAADAPAADSGAIYVFRKSMGGWSEEAKLTASDGTSGASLGSGLDVQGDVLIAGAWLALDGGSEAGAAYVYRREFGIWTEEAKLVPAGAIDGGEFGWQVSTDGALAVVSATLSTPSPGGNAPCFVFRRGADGWREYVRVEVQESAAIDWFRPAVSIQGQTIVLGNRFGPNGGAGVVVVSRLRDDCNGNSIPDDCDLAFHTSNDCNENATPDECDIAAGTAADFDSNGRPDNCRCHDADVNCDGVANGLDLGIIKQGANWNMSVSCDGGLAERTELVPRADVNRDCVVDGLDMAIIRQGANWNTSTGLCECTDPCVSEAACP